MSGLFRYQAEMAADTNLMIELKAKERSKSLGPRSTSIEIVNTLPVGERTVI